MFQGDGQLSTFAATKNILAPGINSFFKIFRSLKTNSTRHLDRVVSLSRQIDYRRNRHESSFEICQYNWVAKMVHECNFAGFLHI